MKKLIPKIAITIASLLLMPAAQACITCNQKTRDAILNTHFYVNVFSIIAPFILLGALVALLSILATHRYKRLSRLENDKSTHSFIPLTTASTILGIGMGGFADGIVLHQILQWHEMLSNRLPPVTLEAKTVNMFWDGIFHLFTFLVTLTGIIMLWRVLHQKAINRSGWLLTGGMLLGWAMFNILEGLANHHILKLHNVREITSSVSVWNWGFLIFSVLLGAMGAIFIRKGRAEANR